MNIETKFNIGDTVYTAENGNVESGIVTGIRISYSNSSKPGFKGKHEIMYFVKMSILSYKHDIMRDERGLSSNKQDIIDMVVSGYIRRLSSVDIELLLELRRKINEHITQREIAIDKKLNDYGIIL